MIVYELDISLFLVLSNATETLHKSCILCLQFSSVAQSCPTLCDPMNRSMLGLPAHHQLPEFTQTHVHRIGDAIQPSHPLSFPSPPAPNPSQHQGLFQWVNSLHEVSSSLHYPQYLAQGLGLFWPLERMNRENYFQLHSHRNHVLSRVSLDFTWCRHLEIDFGMKSVHDSVHNHRNS